MLSRVLVQEYKSPTALGLELGSNIKIHDSSSRTLVDGRTLVQRGMATGVAVEKSQRWCVCLVDKQAPGLDRG